MGPAHRTDQKHRAEDQRMSGESPASMVAGAANHHNATNAVRTTSAESSQPNHTKRGACLHADPVDQMRAGRQPDEHAADRLNVVGAKWPRSSFSDELRKEFAMKLSTKVHQTERARRCEREPETTAAGQLRRRIGGTEARAGRAVSAGRRSPGAILRAGAGRVEVRAARPRAREHDVREVGQPKAV